MRPRATAANAALGPVTNVGMSKLASRDTR
jgi:hypothetical protein